MNGPVSTYIWPSACSHLPAPGIPQTLCRPTAHKGGAGGNAARYRQAPIPLQRNGPAAATRWGPPRPKWINQILCWVLWLLNGLAVGGLYECSYAFPRDLLSRCVKREIEIGTRLAASWARFSN